MSYLGLYITLKFTEKKRKKEKNQIKKNTADPWMMTLPRTLEPWEKKEHTVFILVQTPDLIKYFRFPIFSLLLFPYSYIPKFLHS
jgi:hypothetical protein